MDKIGTVGKKDIEEVVDVAQLQVIIHLHKDQDTSLYGTGSQLCYHIMGLVHTKWAPIPGSIKDYIATPKSNGYQVRVCWVLVTRPTFDSRFERARLFSKYNDQEG